MTGSVGVEPGILILSSFPQLWLLEWGCNGLKNVSKGFKDVKEKGISARKVGEMWELSEHEEINTAGQTKPYPFRRLLRRLNRRVTFHRRIEVPSPVFFFFNEKRRKKTGLQMG